MGEAARLKPEHPDIQAEIAVVLRELVTRGETGRLPRLRTTVDALLTLDPDSVTGRSIQAELLANDGRIDEANRVVDHLAAHAPVEDVRAARARVDTVAATALLQSGDWDEALPLINRLPPEQATPLVRRHLINVAPEDDQVLVSSARLAWLGVLAAVLVVPAAIAGLVVGILATRSMSGVLSLILGLFAAELVVLLRHLLISKRFAALCHDGIIVSRDRIENEHTDLIARHDPERTRTGPGERLDALPIDKRRHLGWLLDQPRSGRSHALTDRVLREAGRFPGLATRAIMVPTESPRADPGVERKDSRA
ncbi:MAG: hypothetical protein R2843_04700 [Thermomicrobiales bacterium]